MEFCKSASDDLKRDLGVVASHLNTLKEANERSDQSRINDASTIDATLSRQENILSDIQHSLQVLRDTSNAISQQEWFLNQLYYPSMHQREGRTVTAVSGTFAWIVESSPEALEVCDSQPHSENSNITLWKGEFWEKEKKAQQDRRKACRSDFSSWLGRENGLFHISGKAGSGKSTFMKFIARHHLILRQLEEWAHPKKLVFATFYFTVEGDEIDKSLHGLFRSILFEVVKQCPELIPKIFPSQWRYVTKQGANIRDTNLAKDQFRNEYIEEAFEKLLSQATTSHHRLCLFIDGLDEYGEDLQGCTHLELASKLNTWASRKDVKICVSSRPHLEFIDTFSDSHQRRLHLHELTRLDILQLTQDQFRANPKFLKKFKDYEPFARQIMERSEGVFLWAIMAVRLVLHSAARDDSKEVILGQIRTNSGDLNHLYTRIFDSMSSRDRRTADRMLWITSANPYWEKLTAISYLWLGQIERDPGFPIVRANQQFSRAEVDQLHARARNQLDGYTRGLLEMRLSKYSRYSNGFYAEPPEDRTPFYQVHFIHRTLREYLVGEQLQRLTDQFANLNTWDTFSRIRLAEAIYMTPKRFSERGMGEIFFLLYEALYSRTLQDPTSKIYQPPRSLTVELLGKLMDLTSLDPFRLFLIHFCWEPYDEGIYNVEFQDPDSSTLRELPFISLAAIRGFLGYTLKKLEQCPHLQNPRRQGSLLLSVLLSTPQELNQDSRDVMMQLVQKLLHWGWSFNDEACVRFFESLTYTEVDTTSIIVICICQTFIWGTGDAVGLAENGWYQTIIKHRFTALEVIIAYGCRVPYRVTLLRKMSRKDHEQVSAENAALPYYHVKLRDPYTACEEMFLGLDMPFWVIVQVMNPPNRDRLLELLRRCSAKEDHEQWNRLLKIPNQGAIYGQFYMGLVKWGRKMYSLQGFLVKL